MSSNILRCGVGKIPMANKIAGLMSRSDLFELQILCSKFSEHQFRNNLGTDERLIYLHES